MVLLTGASGFLGNVITKHFELQQAQVLSIGRQAKNNIVCDLSIEIPTINANSIEVVIHAAGKAHAVPKSISEKQAFFDVNLVGTRNLLKGLETLTKLPKYFVFISSVAVYGQETGENINENAPLNAKDPYGLSKIQAEELVAQWCNNNKVIFTIFRLPSVAGVNPPGNMGAMIKGIQKGYYFNIAGGKAKKSMVLATDVAEAITKACLIGGTYNLTDGLHPTFAALSNRMAEQLNKRKPINLPLWLAFLMAKIGDILGNKAPLNTSKLKKITSDLTFDNSKACNTFGWKPNSVLKELNILINNK